MVATRKTIDDEPIEDAVARLDETTLRRLLSEAARWHTELERAVRLAAAGDDDRLVVLQQAVDTSLRTRRFLDYYASNAWAREGDPVVDALAVQVAEAPSAELIKLLQRAAGHLVKVIMHADDSSGMIGDLCRRVLALHVTACSSGAAEPKALAKWMVKFAFEDQDFFVIDPVAYVDALGDQGLAAYRAEVAKRSEPQDAPDGRPPMLDRFYGEFPSFAAKYAAERLALIDHDIDRLIELVGGDLTNSHQFLSVANAMVELGRPDDALAWVRRGIDETSGFAVFKLYDLGAELLDGKGDAEGVVELRRTQHAQAPSASTYAGLQRAAAAIDVWDDERVSAREVLAQRSPSGFIDALLADGDVDEAWDVAVVADPQPSSDQWVRLAEAREPTHPADAMKVYLRLTNERLEYADKRNYRSAVTLLTKAKRAAGAAGLDDEFDAFVQVTREANRRRPTFIKLLDKAKLTGVAPGIGK